MDAIIMRPQILFSLFTPITTLPGIGPRNAKFLERLAGSIVVDLLWLLPRDIVDRRYMPLIREASAERIATLKVTVSTHIPSSNKRHPYRILCRDGSGEMTLVFFHARSDYLKRTLPEGEIKILSGRLERFRGDLQMTHPDYIVDPEDIASVLRVEPVYPLTAAISPKTLTRAIQFALDKTGDLPEWIDSAFLQQRQWPDWKSALLSAHAPDDIAALSPVSDARSRLAYDELLANQLALGLMRESQRVQSGRKNKGDGTLRKKVQRALPFKLTDCQEQVITEIDEDMASEGRMLRLLQGDVGSGKTVVALFMMLNGVASGGQAAIMAPTEILARQHLATISTLTSDADLTVMLLTGRDRGTARSKKLAMLASGDVDIIIGTHALFQDDVVFLDLRAAVIDEQHRFGVHQRLMLSRKGDGVDTLVMTATPIPRSLMLTAFGDLDVSRLTQKPPGRTPVVTRIMPLDRHGDVIDALDRALKADAKIYWVCPLVEESETLDLAAAEERFTELNTRFNGVVALAHGRMKHAEKDEAVSRFSDGDARILVATTVIEVGVDVPDATVMVIEHAERFGLAQLHQLRGRIGRGEQASTCLLLYGQPLTETAQARLKIIRETEDGFQIAEEDLKIRGAGEMLGTRQSGMPQFKVADIAFHGDLLATARNDAKLIINRDPDLKSPRGEALRVLLYLFGRDAAVLNLRSG
jgi:ATP-dependent DNA helicase RecG